MTISGHRRWAVGAALALALGFGAWGVNSTRAASTRTASKSSDSAGGTLTFTRLESSDAGFGPSIQNSANDAIPNALLFSNLVKVAPNEKTVLPDLATSWRVSPNAKVFTFHLRHGVTWSDGKPFTAADVVFTITLAAHMGAPGYDGYQPTEWFDVLGASKLVGKTQPLAGVKALNAYTVQITLAQPNSNYVRRLTDAVYAILPEHILHGATAKTIYKVPFTTSTPVGTGPYTLEKYVANQYIEFKARPDYFGGEAKIGKLFFELDVSEASAVAQLATGQLQLVLELNPTDESKVQQTPGLKVVSVESPGGEFLQFRVDNPQVSSPLVREAIYYAIDRRAMLKNLFLGNGVVDATFPGFNQNDPNLNQYPYDPAKAKALLAAAHFDFSTPLQILYGPTIDPLWPQMAPVIQQYLKNVGINAVLDPLDVAKWTAIVTGTKPTYALSLQSGGANGLGPDESSSLFDCKALQLTYYANCAVTNLYTKAAATLNPTTRASYYAQIARILNRDLPFATLWQTNNVDAYSTKLGGTFKIFSNDIDSVFTVTGWTLSK